MGGGSPGSALSPVAAASRCVLDSWGVGQVITVGRMRINRRRLRPHALEAKARQEAKRLADDWQAAGLAVDLVEYFATATDTGGYGLTARSSTSVLSCRCQSWL